MPRSCKDRSLADLGEFHGSQSCIRHALIPNIHYSEGAQYVADNADAHWLIDEIAFSQRTQPAVADVEYQVWKLEVAPDCSGELTCESLEGAIVARIPVPWTNFPRARFELHYAQELICLPAER